jgi:hypothetical protein
MMWIQRNKNGNSIEPKFAPKAKTIKTKSTKPAKTVRPNEVKIDVMKALLIKTDVLAGIKQNSC